MKATKICVIGLGYVGLPLARLFSTKYETVGFDMNQKRVEALMAGHDATLEVSDDLLQNAINNHGFKCTANIEDIKDCNFYIVAVPTPVDENNNPDLSPLYGASIDQRVLDVVFRLSAADQVRHDFDAVLLLNGGRDAHRAGTAAHHVPVDASVRTHGLLDSLAVECL